MSDGERPENKKKNRYRNNLPYDDTRVKLSIINDDPFSNYINASHVYGFGGVLKYIASQGPKDANVNTIGDFWRMIREQHISVIVMVANFVEGGKVI
nr:tyrosine-protein phosphatase non-receptor type 18-like [Cherax quadricarinatus]